jgi:single-strand DNA-binding protein
VKNGEERKADFIDIVCWRHTAEFVCRYFAKGSLIAVEGQLQSRTYKAKDGTNRYVVEVVADNVSFTGENRNIDNGSPVLPAKKTENTTDDSDASESYYEGDFSELPNDDDLPF